MKFSKRETNNGESVDVEAYRIFDKDFKRLVESYFCNNNPLRKDTQLNLALILSHKTEYDVPYWFIRSVNNNPTFEIMSNDEFMKTYIPIVENSSYQSSSRNRDSRITEAYRNTVFMETNYEKEISHSISDSKIYDGNTIDVEIGYYDTKINVILEGTTETLYIASDNFKTLGDKIAILNFASYTNPGGGYLNGSLAQEEQLCFNSSLYNVLNSKQDDFYEYNRCHKNNGLYSNRILYSPDIVFKSEITNGIRLFADVITCAAPNKSALETNGHRSLINRVDDVMISRIDFILNVAYQNHVDHLIVGPFGCGVFGNNPYIVANAFKKLLNTKYKGVFKSIFISLPISKNAYRNVKVFWDVFSNTYNTNNSRKESEFTMKQKFKKVLGKDQKLDRKFKPGDVVRHFKGNLYQIVDIAQHTETGEKFMIYRSLYPDKQGNYNTYARPYDMFVSKVDTKKYPDEKQEYRLEKIYFEDVVNK